MKNKVFDYYGNLLRPNNLETKNIVINEKSYKDFVIYSTKYDCGKTVTMFSL